MLSRISASVMARRLLQATLDACLVALAFLLAFVLRFDPRIPSRYDELLGQAIAFVVVGKLVVFWGFGLYPKLWRLTDGKDLQAIVRAVVVASFGLVVAFFLIPSSVALDPPRGVIALDFLLTLALVAGVCLLVRAVFERRFRPPLARKGAREVLIVGAGNGGQLVAAELRRNPELGGVPIGFVDDDPRKAGVRVAGLKVEGTTGELPRVLDGAEPDEVIIAIPSAPGTLRAKVVTACRDRDIPVRTLPTVFELLRGGVQLTRQLREVQVEDVLGRDPVVMELDRVGAYLHDKVVMVTGAGGSIGSELCRQIARVRPKLLVLLDHAEDNLFEMDREMTEQWHFTRVESVLADCREGDRMLEVMQRFKPDVVFHAAAYKHVPLMEENPLEAVRNNALATRVTAETAAVAGCSRFVLVSTDKAVSPRTVMGASKALAEWIVEAAGARHSTTGVVIVRFGNVLASSGSVVPIFRAQIERGGPVTVTHPEMTRYFMTIPEATQLVIQAGDLGSASGEVFVLEMGEPVKIIELARNMIHLAGYEPEEDIAIEIIGIRPGEKIHEELFNFDERPQATTAERIVRAVRAEPLDPDWVEGTVDELLELVAAGDEAGLAEH